MEKITNIEIKNFKSIRHQKIDGCKRINVFIGYPNVGKSNILEALGCWGMLKRNLFKTENEFITLTDFIRLDGLSSCFFEGNTGESIEVISNQGTLTIELSEKFLYISTDYKNNVSSGIYFNSDYLSAFSSKGYGGFGDINKADDFDKIIKSEKWIPINIQKYNFDSAKIKSNFSTQGGFLNFPLGENLMGVLLDDKKLLREVGELLKPSGYKFLFDNKSPLRIFKQLDENSIFSLDFSMIADTLQRLIFYKTAIKSNNNCVLLLEEPEAHMFPPYIKSLTSDIIFDKNDNQYFIATHSPFVLNELIEEVQDELSVYVVDYDKGETIIKRLTDEEVTEISQYGIDLFFNLESYLEKNGQPHSA